MFDHLAKQSDLSRRGAAARGSAVAATGARVPGRHSRSLRQLRCLVVAAAGIMVLAACGGVSRLAPDPPASVDLSGVWRLDVAASDDPRKVLEKLRPRRRSRRALPAEGAQSGRGRRGQGSSQEGPDGTEDESMIVEAPSGASLLAFIPNSDLLRNEVMAIRQSPDALVFDYGTSVRRLTPGARSVVSVPGGVADQSTGWKGKDYVVELRSQAGIDMTERYSLSTRNGRQLIVDVHLSGSGIPNVNLTRVYGPGGSEQPRALPNLE